jgi:NAD(P)-dependent dehydrogenase (short-subunit alcohol dehydrogenase family)
LAVVSDHRRRIGIITGASRGFGKALSSALVDQGWSLVVDARGEDGLREAVDQLEARGSVVGIPGDVTDPSHRQRMIDAATDLGGLDLLVNNASILGPSPQPRLADYPLDVLARVYEVNVLAPLALIQLALPLLRRHSGLVVNITSDAATGAYAGWGGYGSSKAALNQLSNVLGEEEEGVRVVWYDPGDMNTAMHQEAFPDEDISDRPAPEESVPSLLEIITGEAGGFHQVSRS